MIGLQSHQCTHCEEWYALEHHGEHPGLCCDCFDLSCGMPLEQLNKERKAKGLKPIEKEWKR